MGKKLTKELKKNGKIVFDGPPKAKERKRLPKPTQAHKKAKGKGSYNRKKENLKEMSLINKMLDSLLEENLANAHKYLELVIESKIQRRIADEIQTPLF